MDSWTELTPSLSESTLSTLERLKFHKTTPVQATTIPLMLTKKDVAVEAVTGSGKTLAFAIPVVEKISRENLDKFEVFALVISPTRELSIQISGVFDEFLQNDELKVTSGLFIGGKSVSTDVEKFNKHGANIMVCTPGRLDDMLSGRTSTTASAEEKLKAGLKSLEFLILDEADRLLSSGFERELNSILSYLPKQRRTGLFSATQTKDVQKLIRAGLRNPVFVSVKEDFQQGQNSDEKRGDEGQSQNEKDKQSNSNNAPKTLKSYFHVVAKPEDKFDHLVAFLRKNTAPKLKNKAMLFFATCASVEYHTALAKKILGGWRIFGIHGKKSDRNKVFEAFRKAEAGILICTDVMARGVDVPDVNWVLQYDPPSNAEAFVHRCGRTARIGKAGAAVLFLLPNEEAYVEFLRLNQKVTLEPLERDFPLTLGEAEAKKSFIPTLGKLREWQKADRSLFDLANRAFVSFIQSYTKHECNYVLSLKELPMGSVAMSYGLLKMPKMPELRKNGSAASDFKPDKTFKENDIKYKDKQKEKSRQEKLKVFNETGVWPGSKAKARDEKNSAWSKKVDKKDRKLLRKKANELKRKKGQQEEDYDSEDMNELKRDYAQLKKLKKTGRRKEKSDALDKALGLEEFSSEAESE